jgi:tetratricopeptide (TPR) repeat protein
VTANAIRRWAFAAGLGVLAPSTALAAGPGLPPIECVQALRQARIEAAAQLGETARTRLEAAAAIPECELPALSQLLQSLRDGAAPDAAPGPDVVALEQRLAHRLEDPATTVPPGMLRYLAAAASSPAQNELVLTALQTRRRRIASAGAELSRDQEIELLSAILDLEEDLKRPEEAHDTVFRLLELDDSALWRWQALELDVDLERWDELASLIPKLRSLVESSDPLDRLEVLALAHLGRFDEMLARIERLKPVRNAAASAPHAVLLVDGVGQEDAATATGSDRVANRNEPEFASYVGLLVQAGWALRDAGRDADAERVFRRAHDADPDNGNLREILLHLYASAEERDTFAAQEAERRSRVTNPDALYEEGTQLLAAGDAAGAYDLLARAAPAIEGGRLGDAPWYNLGLAAYELKRWQEAADAFAHAAAINPARPESEFQRGVALFFLDRCNEAVPVLRRALELAPDKYKAHYYLGDCLARLGRNDEAARERQLYHRAAPPG